MFRIAPYCWLLPSQKRYYNGSPPEIMRFGSAWPGANVQLVDKNIDVAPDIHLISLVSDKPGTLELRELSLAISTPDGLVIVVGCSHAGIDKIVESAAVINPRIHLIVGGFHLVTASDLDIEKTARLCTIASGSNTLLLATAQESQRSPPSGRLSVSIIFTPAWEQSSSLRILTK